MQKDTVQSPFAVDYWHLCDELNIIQAALLVVDEDPSSTEAYVEGWNAEQRPPGYEAAKNAISKALRSKKIEGRHIPKYEYDIDGNRAAPIDDSIHLEESTVDVSSLREWLFGRGFRSGFFFTREASLPGYLNPKDDRYAPKLAAAVAAWQAFEALDLAGRSPKQALSKWLREHAVEFDLTNEDGNPNETGIEDVAKVANWQRGGGAPKTPG